MALRSLHRASAIVLAVYAFVHVANHLTALHSIQTHLSVMHTLRKVYLVPATELLLLSCAAFQVGSGLWLVGRGWRGRVGRVAWLQALSGLYMAFFLLVHVSAVLFGRTVLGLDTNFYFAAAGFQVPPLQWFFAPYYALAVLALFAHLACAVYWRFHLSAPQLARQGLATGLVAGVLCSIAITTALAGLLQPFEVPLRYKATYQAW